MEYGKMCNFFLQFGGNNLGVQRRAYRAIPSASADRLILF